MPPNALKFSLGGERPKRQFEDGFSFFASILFGMNGRHFAKDRGVWRGLPDYFKGVVEGVFQ